MKIYIDESGNTGADYLNIDQPYFVLAANWMDESDCDDIREKVFSKFQGKEYKFSKILKGNEERIFNLIRILKEKNDLFHRGCE